MKKLLVLLAALAMTATMAGVAAADHAPNPHPAQNATQCAAAGGVFTVDTSTTPDTNICTVTVQGGTTTAPASHPQQSWTVEVTTAPTVHTYTASGGTRTHTQTGGETTVTACFNEQGRAVGGYETNPNCKPSP